LYRSFQYGSAEAFRMSASSSPSRTAPEGGHQRQAGLLGEFLDILFREPVPFSGQDVPARDPHHSGPGWKGVSQGLASVRVLRQDVGQAGVVQEEELVAEPEPEEPVGKVDEILQPLGRDEEELAVSGCTSHFTEAQVTMPMLPWAAETSL
jgi:hypothetical protein